MVLTAKLLCREMSCEGICKRDKCLPLIKGWFLFGQMLLEVRLFAVISGGGWVCERWDWLCYVPSPKQETCEPFCVIYIDRLFYCLLLDVLAVFIDEKQQYLAVPLYSNVAWTCIWHYRRIDSSEHWYNEGTEGIYVAGILDLAMDLQILRR